MPYISSHVSRRAFLKRASVMSAYAGTPFIANLMTIGAASAQATTSKALVCIFLNGGNDQSNTVVPFSGDAYAGYASARPNIALKQNQLLKLNANNWAGPELALNGRMKGLSALFDQGHVALISNVGVLNAPISISDWNQGAPKVAVPYQLFSHADQIGAWQTGVPDRPSATGWLGRIGDMTAKRYNGGSQLSIAMSVAGNNIMQTGDSTIQYQVTIDGAVKVRSLDSLNDSAISGATLRKLMTSNRSNLLENELAATGRRAIGVESLVTSSLTNSNVTTSFPVTSLGNQLKMVARMIGAQSALSQKRQIFFVQAGGYDFHDNLLVDQNNRLGELSDAMAAFYEATVELGVANDVTTFTASDFGRALQSNGRGTDHGWGSHHFVMGGSVKGNTVYGDFPTVALKTSQDAGQGRLIPTTSVDQYAATLASWFGVPTSDLSTALPNLNRFPKSDLGFMS